MLPMYICLQLEKGSWIVISGEDILYIAAGDSYATFVTTKGNYLSLSSMNTIETKLNNGFCRVHRSYIISIQHTRKFNLDHVLIASHNIPVSKQYRSQLMKMLNMM